MKFVIQAGNPPSVVVSALYGRGTDAIFPTALTVFDRWRTRISTGILNRWLEAITFRHPPPRTSSGKEVKLKQDARSIINLQIFDANQSQASKLYTFQ